MQYKLAIVFHDATVLPVSIMQLMRQLLRAVAICAALPELSHCDLIHYH